MALSHWWRLPTTRIRTQSHHQTGTSGFSLSFAPTLSVDLPEGNESIELCLPAMLAKGCTALYMYPCFASATTWLQTRNFHHGRWDRWAGLFSYNPAWFKLSRACSGWPWHPTTEWGTDIVVGGHYHYQRNWWSSFIVLEKQQGALINIYCLGQHAAHGGGVVG